MMVRTLNLFWLFLKLSELYDLKCPNPETWSQSSNLTLSGSTVMLHEALLRKVEGVGVGSPRPVKTQADGSSSWPGDTSCSLMFS